MRDVKGAADGIGQRMHRRDRRIGKGLTRQHGPQQHCTAGVDIAAVGHHGFDIGPKQTQGFAGEQLGHGVVVRIDRRIGFNRVDHRINPRCRRNRRRQSNRQGRVQNGHVRQDHRRRHAALFLCADGDDRHGRDL